MSADHTDYRDLEQIARHAAGKLVFASAGHQVDDVVSEAMAEYIVYARTHEIDNPAAFITIVARRKAMKYRDAWEARRGFDWIDDVEAARNTQKVARAGRAVAVDVSAADPLVAIVAEADRSAVLWAVAQLDDVDRQIIELTYLGSAPQQAAAVAARLGLAPKTVRNRLVAIRRELATVLSDLDDC